MLVAFDVDDTLIVPAIATGLDRDVPNYETIAVYRWFQAQGHEMVVWSGGGEGYARSWGEKLGLNANIYADKHAGIPLGDNEIVKRVPALTFDDSDLTLGVINVKVKRLNNGIVRYPDRLPLKRGEAQKVTR